MQFRLRHLRPDSSARDTGIAPALLGPSELLEANGQTSFTAVTGISRMPDKSFLQMRRFTQVRRRHLQQPVYESILGMAMNTDRLVTRLLRPTFMAVAGRKG